MNKKTLGILVFAAVVAAAMAVNLSCTTSKPEPPTSEETGWDGDPSTLLASHRGQVLILLVGMDACPGTAAGTPVLKDYAAQKPEGVSIVRLDVPPPGKKLQPVPGRDLPFGYAIDNERVVADELGFFYYPTFYILGPEGDVRFAGECDADRFPEMVAEILAEKPGEEKHVYTPPLPPEGTQAPAFSGTTLDGETVTLDELRGEKATVLIFAETACPFSTAAAPGMKKLQDSFADKQVAVVIINKRESADTIRPIYAERAPGMTVLVDEASEIAKAYSVTPVPFCFVLDGDAKIAKRMPYTQDAATDALNLALGLTPPPPGDTAPGAG
jgi:peroxiredoxin